MCDHDQLDRLLKESSPKVTALDTALNDALTRMAFAADSHSKARVQRPARRPAKIALTVALVSAGAGAAAATDGWQWHPWLEEPDAAFTVTYPTGTQCEYRMNTLSGGIAEAVEATRSFAAQNDLAALADVDHYIADIRAQGQWIHDQNGVLQPNGPGSALYDADWEYQQALNQAVNALVRQHLADEGIQSVGPTGRSVEVSMQGDCGGTE